MENINYTWFIDQMFAIKNLDGHENFVSSVFWRCVGASGEAYATQIGQTELPTLIGESFTPYEQLTQDQVLSWCWANGLDRASIEDSISVEIEDKLLPKIVALPNPWADLPET
jgi:hypothetical protein